ncbi:MAG: N-acetylglucosamine kinase [Bacteroidales bacterium]
MHVLGIDAGATKTVCLLANEHQQVIAESRGGGANLAVDDELSVEKALHAVMEEATRGLARPPDVVCLGMAGVDRPKDGRMARAIMRRLGYGSRVLVVNDALLALVAGAPTGPAVVVIAGTGAIAYGRNANNQAARASGWGYLLDDEGSGYWIGAHALKAVMRHADDRGPATDLTPRVLAHFGVAQPSDLVHVVYYRDLSRQDIAGLTVLVEQSRAVGDAVAARILEEAAAELARAAASVTRRLSLEHAAATYVLAGGVFRGVPWIRGAVAEHLRALAPRSTVVPLEVEPALGAVRLAIAHADGHLVLPSYVGHEGGLVHQASR